MNEIKIFENAEFGQIRTVEIDGEPWLVGKDVAEALGYSNPQKAVRDHVDTEDRGVNEMVTLEESKI
ncbi:BRO-N domain-containing protein [Robinsoniella sp. KNHs210]|uniref:BRO-N domain-containing protein n=1 Tax=Robinsoniella sp. KNHs210 TaxID=1469950 RepID=UPI000480CBCA|nr:BRO family protein [Robinsoniella sp. KNHs210]